MSQALQRINNCEWNPLHSSLCQELPTTNVDCKSVKWSLYKHTQ